MVRLAPMIAPVMHEVNVYVHYFYVPNRIIWNQWEDFIGGGQDGDSTPTMPTVTFNSQCGKSTLGDYLGLGGTIAGAVYNPELNALPFRAYQQIFNDYYRNPNLDDEVDYTLESAAVSLRTRRWNRDYFTSCLPWAQRGSEVSSPISFNPNTGDWDDVWDVSGAPTLSGATPLSSSATGDLVGGTFGKSIDNTANLDMLINDLRNSSAIQRFLENNATGGYRYVEQLLHRWGIKSSDARLQRAEYLGGGRQPIVFSEVLNTSATATQPQGEMAGHGISVGLANRMSKRFEEHGQLLGIMSIVPKTGYYQGIPKKFLRNDKFDYYSPEFANLGEQEVTSQELYFNSGGASSSHTQVFGYQQRWAEYKYCQGAQVHGEYRDSLDFWHMDREFTSRPALNPAFVTADPTTRIFAAPSDPHHCWIQLYNDVKARRQMPYFSKPSLR